MLTLKKLVEECRKLRGEMSISPAQKLPLIIIGDTYLINEFKDYLQLLAKLESIEIVENFEKANAPVAIVDNFKLMFNIQIDVASEKNRLKKEINRITLELKKAQGKLSNDAFINKAPAEVIEQERERSDKFSDELERFKSQLDRLND